MGGTTAKKAPMGHNYVIIRAPNNSWFERHKTALGYLGLSIVFMTFVIQQRYVEPHRENLEGWRYAALDLSAGLRGGESYRKIAELFRPTPNRSPVRVDIRAISANKQWQLQGEMLTTAEVTAQEDHDLEEYIAKYQAFLPHIDRDAFSKAENNLSELQVTLQELRQRQDTIYRDNLLGRENNDNYLVTAATTADKLSDVWNTLSGDANDEAQSVSSTLAAAEQRYEFWSGIGTLSYGIGWLLSVVMFTFGEKPDLGKEPN